MHAHTGGDSGGLLRGLLCVPGMGVCRHARPRDRQSENSLLGRTNRLGCGERGVFIVAAVE